MTHRIRPLEPRDDPQVAALIREVMPEFGAVGPGFAIEDPEVDSMHAAYAGAHAGYWVVVDEGDHVVGGAGYAALEGGPEGVCELRKMYLRATVRGLGLGAALLTTILEHAAAAGFTRCYLETLEHMHAAKRLYERFGFEAQPGPMGATGHHGCDAWYVRSLAPR